MNFEEYQSEASQTAHYPRRMSNLEYPTLGLTGEAGEVANIVKKIQRDHDGILTDEIRGKLKDELGDVLWYISACADELGITLHRDSRIQRQQTGQTPRTLSSKSLEFYDRA